jgi:uncharacterized protein (DUF1778 family)
MANSVGSARPDLYSAKTEGKIAQSVRITVEENNLIKEAANLEGFSLNLWMKRVLLRAARAKVASAKGNGK